MFGALYSIDGPAANALLEVAADFTPRYESYGPDQVVLDLTGLERLFGGPREIGEELCHAAADRQTRVRVAIAGTCTAARLIATADGRESVVVVDAGTEAAALAPLHLTLLANIVKNDSGDGSLAGGEQRQAKAGPGDLSHSFLRWGIRTVGELAALPADAVAARLGSASVQWQRLARGEDLRPLRPEVPKERFEQELDLEWPIEGLEPLSFVLGRLLEPLSAHLDRRGRGAAVLHIRLHLVDRTVHERSLQLPAPMRDARTFRTLLLLDLESHPPSAAIDRVVVAVDPTPARIVQLSLLVRPLPSPEQLSTLTARLAALMGEDRCGSPVVVDTWQPGAFAMKPFNPGFGSRNPAEPGSPIVALRRFRIPVLVRVRVEHDKPVHVTFDRSGALFGSRIPDPGSRIGGRVERCAGPWRTSGGWWTGRPSSVPPRRSESDWDRDEWDVTLSDGATYRVFRQRATAAWFLEGIVD
jgi:protein ImuB